MLRSRKIVLRNFRSFTWETPIELEFNVGFTALVGPNNSGKSSALRSVYELRHYFIQLPGIFLKPFRITPGFQGVLDETELANEKSPDRFQLEIHVEAGSLLPEPHYWHAVSITLDFHNTACTVKSLEMMDSAGEKKTIAGETIHGGQPYSPGIFSYSNVNARIDYTLIFEFASELSRARYYPAFRNAINEGGNSYYDIPVGVSLVQAWHGWKAGDNKSNLRAIGRVEREIAQLLGFTSLQINADATGKTLNIVIDHKPHKLYEVGAGVAQLIIVLAAALIHKPTFILIDEPELSLHPALQLSFLATLGSYAEFTTLYSTHSIGLARSTADRILMTRKTSTGSRMDHLASRTIHFSEMLGELGYSGRAELGCDGLLVEGPTDVLVFQELLRKINKDGSYVVMQLGGNSLINGNIHVHLAEISRIVDVNNIWAFIDSEIESEDGVLGKDRRDFLAACERSGIKAFASKRRATENYFDEETISSLFRGKHKSLGAHEKLGNSQAKWGKSENWKIARAMPFASIANTDLGEFLTSLPKSQPS